MVACILDNISLNVGLFVLSEFWTYKAQDGPMLIFSSLITELYKRAGVKEYLEDTWIVTKAPIYQLKMHGKGIIFKRKENLYR